MRRGRARARLLAPAAALACLVLATAARAIAADEPAIPAYVGFVNDRAEVMDEPARAKLEAFLVQLREKTGAEFAVLTMKSVAPLSAGEYKVLVFQQWKLGQRGKDNGLLMLVVLDEREAIFETGYGLEGTLPDGWLARVFHGAMAPRFQAGDFASGITAGALACAARIAAEQGVALQWNGEELRYTRGREDRELPWWALLIVALVALGLVSRIARYGTPGGWMMGPRGRGGGFGSFGGGFGGFGGFGGGFGGGGSFGGFGGGASGGGGGGGHW